MGCNSKTIRDVDLKFYFLIFEENIKKNIFFLMSHMLPHILIYFYFKQAMFLIYIIYFEWQLEISIPR